MDISIRTRGVFGNEDQRWVAQGEPLAPCLPILLGTSLFDRVTRFPNGYIPSGTPLVRQASGLYGPYVGGTNEVQSVTITGAPTGGTFTITGPFGNTTAPIAYNATAATVQAALRALPSLATPPGGGPGIGPKVSVTGNAGGPYTVTFTGDLSDQDVPAMTASGAGLTGGTTPSVVIATPTPGAIDVGEVGVGHLFTTIPLASLYGAVPGPTLGAALFWSGAVYRNYLPFDVLDPQFEAACTHILYLTHTV